MSEGDTVPKTKGDGYPNGMVQLLNPVVLEPSKKGVA